jgi:hypothetical protein
VTVREPAAMTPTEATRPAIRTGMSLMSSPQ